MTQEWLKRMNIIRDPRHCYRKQTTPQINKVNAVLCKCPSLGCIHKKNEI